MNQVVSSQPPSTGPTTPTSGSGAGGGGIWKLIKQESKRAGQRAAIAASQTKIRAEIMLIDQKIEKRKKKFGVELYDTLVIQAEQDPAFIIDGDTLENIRGEFVTAFKDNKALLQKKARQQQALVELEEKKAIAYPKVPPDTISGQMKNAGIAANFARQEAGHKTRISVIEADMKSNKKKFGVGTYAVLVELEDKQKWLSPDRDVRFLYDSARREISKMIAEKQQKEAEWGALAETPL